jgi:hypothetical protein
MHKHIIQRFKHLPKEQRAAIREQATNSASFVCHAFIASYYESVGKQDLAAKTRADCPRAHPAPLAHEIAGSNGTVFLDIAIVPRDYEPIFYTPPIPDNLRGEFARNLLHNVEVIRSMPIIYGQVLPKQFSLVFSQDLMRIELCVDGRVLTPAEFPNSLGVVHFYKIGGQVLFPSHAPSKENGAPENAGTD